MGEQAPLVLALFDWVVLSLLLSELEMLLGPPGRIEAPTPVAEKTESEAIPAPTVNALATWRNLGICYLPMFKGSAEPAVTGPCL